MSIRVCPAHGGEFRKGKRVVLVDVDGKPRTKLVCAACAQRGVVVVATIVAPVIKRKVDPGEEVARVIARLKAYTRGYEVELGGTELMAEFARGKVQGYETAITMLERIGKE